MFQPFIERDKCTCCRECANICPKDVIDAEDGEIRVTDPRFCTGCEACEAVCPENAVRVEEI
jgi:ferredoxin hydrogenase